MNNTGILGFYLFDEQFPNIALADEILSNSIREKKLFVRVPDSENIASVNGIVIAYEGKIYNTGQLSRHVEKKAKSNAELLCHLYEKFGIDFIKLLDGKCAIFLIDTRRDTVFLVRDELGQKPLYYTRNTHLVAFSSRQRDLISYLPIEPQIDRESLYSYLYYGYVPTPRSLIKDIFKVPSSSYIEISKDRLCGAKYWSLSYDNKFSDSLETLVKRLEEQIQISLQKSISGRGTSIGLLLSGGLDSGTLLAISTKTGINVNSYTISVGGAHDESELAAKVSAIFNSRHQTIAITPKDIEVLANLITNVFDEPFSDPSLIPTSFIYSQIKEKFIIAGDGGDELLGGYPKYVAHDYAETYKRIPRIFRRLFLDRLIERYASRIPVATKGKIREFISNADLPLAVRNQEWVCQFKRDEINTLLNATEPSWLFSEVNNYASWFNGRAPSEKAMFIDINVNLVDQYNMKVDASSRYSLLDVECPLLNKDLFQFAASLPAEYKVNKSTTKYILRELDKKYLPHDIIYRPKTGFGIPLDRILRTILPEMVGRYLEPNLLVQSGISNPDPIITLVSDHMQEKKDNSNKLWTLLTLMKWIEGREALA